MLETISLDQLRVFIAAAETGSFSAAGRRLKRAQSVVSQTISSLERELGVTLFDRGGRYPALTPAGRLLLADAGAVTQSMNALKARSRGMAAGVEPELSAAIDVMFPMDVLTQAAAGFSAQFPSTALRLYVEALGGVAKAVLDGQCSLGVIGTLPVSTPGLVMERLLGVEMVFTAAPNHPLAQFNGPIPDSELAKHTQLVLTDRTDFSAGQEFQVRSARTWRLADLGAKHAFLRAGLGWGGMPRAMIERDLQENTLSQLTLQDSGDKSFQMPMFATYRTSTPPGPAGRWFVSQLQQAAAAAGVG
jgi:DNA-binding transcriptional LysR family regulator